MHVYPAPKKKQLEIIKLDFKYNLEHSFLPKSLITNRSIHINQVKPNPSVEGRAGHKVLPVTGKDWHLLAAERWRVNFFNSVVPDKLIVLQWKVTHPRISEQLKLPLIGKQDTKLEGKGQEVDVERVGREKVYMAFF